MKVNKKLRDGIFLVLDKLIVKKDSDINTIFWIVIKSSWYEDNWYKLKSLDDGNIKSIIRLYIRTKIK